MKNLLILLGILLSSPFVVAQHLAINGNVAIADNSPEGTRVVVTKNGNKLDEQVLNKKGHFDLKLAFDADYKISFEKTGYITKIVSINTEVPEESIENNPDFPPVKLIINLLPSVEKIDLSIFDQPIAILTYQAELDDFTFDKSYSDKIKDRIAQTEQAVKKQLAARDAAAARGKDGGEQDDAEHHFEADALAADLTDEHNDAAVKDDAAVVVHLRAEGYGEAGDAVRDVELLAGDFHVDGDSGHTGAGGQGVDPQLSAVADEAEGRNACCKPEHEAVHQQHLQDAGQIVGA